MAIRRLVLLGLVMVGLASGPAAAQLRLIRDAEIESMVRDLAAPIFSAAGVNPSSVAVYLIDDEQLNAFVAGGQNLFLNTGLIARTERPEQLAGVIAHETGHIAGGHLTRLSDALERAAVEQILGTILGAAAVAVGGADVGQAIMMGGDQLARQRFLRFNRGQEQAADRAAVGYLDEVGIGAEGLLEFFRILEGQQMLAANRISPYLQTHPLTRDRVSFVERHVAETSAAQPVSPELAERHARAVAKITGFLVSPTRTLQRYADDASFAGRYARAIATWKLGDTEGGLAQLRALRADAPDDPFLYELEGQILFESGRVQEAVAPYRRATELAPREPLLRLGHGRALMESGDAEQAVAAFKSVVASEPRNTFAWRLLGIAQGRLGDLGPSNLALAEAALLQRQLPEARLFLGRADRLLPPSGRERQHYHDLVAAVDQTEREARRP